MHYLCYVFGNFMTPEVSHHQLNWQEIVLKGDPLWNGGPDIINKINMFNGDARPLQAWDWQALPVDMQGWDWQEESADFGLSFPELECTQQIWEISTDAHDPRPFVEQKSTKDAHQVPEMGVRKRSHARKSLQTIKMRKTQITQAVNTGNSAKLHQLLAGKKQVAPEFARASIVQTAKIQDRTIAVEMMKVWVRHGYSICACPGRREFWSLFHELLEEWSLEDFKNIFISENIHITNRRGHTLLHHLIQYPPEDLIPKLNWLVEQGAAVNCRDQYGKHVIFSAIESECVLGLEWLCARNVLDPSLNLFGLGPLKHLSRYCMRNTIRPERVRAMAQVLIRHSQEAPPEELRVLARQLQQKYIDRARRQADSQQWHVYAEWVAVVQAEGIWRHLAMAHMCEHNSVAFACMLTHLRPLDRQRTVLIFDILEHVNTISIQEQLLIALLKEGVDLNVCCEGKMAIHELVRGCHWSLLKILVQYRGQYPAIIHVPNRKQQLPMQSLLCQKHADANGVKYLYQLGASLEQRYQERFPLEWAIHSGHMPAALKICELGGARPELYCGRMRPLECVLRRLENWPWESPQWLPMIMKLFTLGYSFYESSFETPTKSLIETYPCVQVFIQQTTSSHFL